MSTSSLLFLEPTQQNISSLRIQYSRRAENNSENTITAAVSPACSTFSRIMSDSTIESKDIFSEQWPAWRTISNRVQPSRDLSFALVPNVRYETYLPNQDPATTFAYAAANMSFVRLLLRNRKTDARSSALHAGLEIALRDDMARAVFGSNVIEKAG
jgi:hypothetical protein